MISEIILTPSRCKYPEFNKLGFQKLKAWPMRAGETERGQVHVPIYSIWSFSTTSHMYDIEVGSVWSGSIAWNTAQPYRLWPGSYPEFKLGFQKLKAWPMRAGETEWGQVHVPIYSIWSFSTTLHMYDIEVGSVWSGSIASNTAQPYRLWPGSYPEFKLGFQKLDQWERGKQSEDRSMCPSTAYEASQPPCICMTLMWDLFGVGP